MFETIIINGIITGISVGFGTIIGNYFSNKLVIKHLEKIETKLIQQKKEKGFI
jgi:uncharacterized protein YneF (UPF0154 family)